MPRASKAQVPDPLRRVLYTGLFDFLGALQLCTSIHAHSAVATPSFRCFSGGVASSFRHGAVSKCSCRGELRFAFVERCQPVMKTVRFMTCVALAGSVVMTAHAGAVGAMVAMPDPSAAGVEGGVRTPVVPVQDDYGRPRGWNGGHDGPGGPGWRGGLPGGWYGRPGWYGDPPGQPRSYPSQWGGGWYGGWYQPYWGQGYWASPNWTYGSEHYWGHYPAPTACGPNGCGQDYVPLK